MFKKIILILASKGYCFINPDPVVNTENKLILALSIAYNIADAIA